MPREHSLQAIVIKKQPFNEADEIVTLLTGQQGKVRALAKSVKLGTSKLQQALQPIFLSQITLTGNGGLPKIIGVQTLQSFPVLQDNPERVKVWFVVAELLNKALADEQPHEPLFALVIDYLQFLNTAHIDSAIISASLLKFKIHFLELIGLQIHAPSSDSSQQGLLFSANRGGFYVGPTASDARVVTSGTWPAFVTLRTVSFAALRNQTVTIEQLQEFINDFISYHLEREIKADKFLAA